MYDNMLISPSKKKNTVIEIPVNKGIIKLMKFEVLIFSLPINRELFTEVKELSNARIHTWMMNSVSRRLKRYRNTNPSMEIRIDHKYDGMIRAEYGYLGVRKTRVAPPTRLAKTRINAIVVTINPCSPLPSVPSTWEIMMAIARFRTAIKVRVPKVFMILPSNGFLG
jgi:hypothetical protein